MSDGNIFNKLKIIKELHSNSELFAIFRHAQLFGLIDLKKKDMLKDAEIKTNKLLKINLSTICLTTCFFIYSYKRNFYNFAYIGAIIALPVTLYLNYKIYNEVNWILLTMKNDYIFQLDEFFKKDKNPLILNPNFLTEEIFDPDLKAYQNIIRYNLYK